MKKTLEEKFSKAFKIINLPFKKVLFSLGDLQFTTLESYFSYLEESEEFTKNTLHSGCAEEEGIVFETCQNTPYAYSALVAVYLKKGEESADNFIYPKDLKKWLYYHQCQKTIISFETEKLKKRLFIKKSVKKILEENKIKKDDIKIII